MDNRMRCIFGPDGQNHLAFKSGNMTFVDEKAYTQAGNMAIGSDGSTYLKAGNAIIGSNGETHLAFGDNPTFLI